MADIMERGEAERFFKEHFAQQRTVFHNDGDNTFAAYQMIFNYNGRRVDIWINARNGDIISMGNPVNHF